MNLVEMLFVTSVDDKVTLRPTIHKDLHFVVVAKLVVLQEACKAMDSMVVVPNA